VCFAFLRFMMVNPTPSPSMDAAAMATRPISSGANVSSSVPVWFDVTVSVVGDIVGIVVGIVVGGDVG
jgi:hypothetical protein